MITLSGRRQIRSGGSGVVTSADVLSPPVPLDSITPTMQSLRLYNGHPAIEFPSGDTESAAAAEILTAAEAGDLMGGVVDGSSPSGVGGNGVDGAIGHPPPVVLLLHLRALPAVFIFVNILFD
ncbi:unnamed protein product [Rodentolepis nana]|uniref:Uncharacterized protein n=1 Tax=Rodentolepis nana TaxID=102285 RepID=A0A0R3TKK6_RODNA|nr:unnamed protein product [Rodentolepis nana]